MNTLMLGTFAPGNSPAISNGTNQGFGGIVEIELGGTTPGFQSNSHDQINDSESMFLVSDPTLVILPWNHFIPEAGDEFRVMTWQNGLSGLFGNIVIDPHFSFHGIDFNTVYDNVGGAGNLTLIAKSASIPEPSALLFGILATILVVGKRFVIAPNTRDDCRHRVKLSENCR